MDNRRSYTNRDCDTEIRAASIRSHCIANAQKAGADVKYLPVRINPGFVLKHPLDRLGLANFVPMLMAKVAGLYLKH